MDRRKDTGGRTMNLLFTMLLFLVFVLCALFTVLFGGRVYENISTRMEQNYSGSVALNYVANKVRQGDRAGLVDVVEIEGTPVLELAQEINDARYVTWIYYREGTIRELFTREDSGLTLADGLEIIECGGFVPAMEENMLSVTTTGAGGGSLMLAVRSGGSHDE